MGSPRDGINRNVGRTSGGSRALAILLTGVPSFEAAFGNGLSTAVADQLSVDQDGQTLEMVTQEEGAELSDDLERTDPWDWTGDTTHLTLSSKGITIDYESAKALVNIEQEGQETDYQLPDRLPATLDLTFELNPTAQNEVEASETSEIPATPEPGDYFTVDMPEGVTLAGTDSLDVFQLDVEEGEPTTVRVAEATPQDEGAALKVTLVEPSAVEDGSDSSQQAEEDDASQALIAGASLSVNLTTSSLSDESSMCVWTLQADATDQDVRQEAELSLPSAHEVAEALAPEAQPDEDNSEKDEVSSTDNAAATEGEYAPDKDSVTTESLTITWADNNNRAGKRPETQAVKKGLSLTFSIDGGKSLTLTPENAQKYFGISAQEDLDAMVSVSETGVGIYTAKASDLYTKIVDGEGKEHTVSWSLSYDAVEGYHRTEDENGNLCYQLLDTFTYHVVTKVGDEELNPTAEPLSNLEFSCGGKTWQVDQLTDQTNQNGMSLKVSEGGTYELTAPAFGTDGLPLEYALACPVELTPDDGYEVSHDNAASPNHGSDISATYDGGTLTIRRVGVTPFTATKQWYDGKEKSGRPTGKTVEFTLWRYTSKDGTPASASQVTDDEGKFVTLTATVSDVDTIDIGELLTKQYPELTLDKYDNDGYPYYYAVREESSFPGYEQVYGQIAEDGSITDMAPNYRAKGSDDLVDDEDWKRSETDRFVYNTGTICNRLTGQVTVEAEKEWVAAAFADQLADVACAFTLQSRIKDSDGEWADTDITETLTGFAAESLTKDFAQSCDKYDSHGNELEYRWVETNVTQKVGEVELSDTEFTPAKEGENGHLTSTFSLWLRESDEGGSSVGDVPDYKRVHFTSEAWAEDGRTHVRNTFEDTVDEKVVKKWAVEGEDGRLKYLDAGDEQIPDHKLTIAVYDENTKVAEAILDGTADGEKRPLENVSEKYADAFKDATYQETDSDVLMIHDLPLYKSDGSRYTYRIIETTDVPEWDTRQAYDAEKHLTTIINTQGKGEKTIICVEKSWVDGGDSAHRLAAQIEVRAAENIRDSSGNVVYTLGDLIPVHEMQPDGNFGSDNATSVLLTEDGAWFTTLAIYGVSDIPLGSLSVTETHLVSAGDGEGNGATFYEVVSYEDAKKNDEYKGEAWVNYGWGSEGDGTGFNNAQHERVATDEHVYEVRCKSTDAKDSPFQYQTYRIVNRRIGLINIDVTKEWLDGASPKKPRPEAVYRLTCSDEGAEFATDASGNVTIQLSDGNILPLFSEDAKLSDADLPARLTGTIEDNGRTLEVPVPADGGTVNFCGLPKYNGRGEVVSYSVTEKWADGSDRDNYATSTELQPYTVGPRHFNDKLSYGITNKLVGSREVVFFKQWKDEYVADPNTPGQRPDINLDLYRVSAKKGSTPEQVGGYVKWTWEALKEEDGTTSQYNWKVSAPNLPSYDDEGYAYTYYAIENMAAGAESLDYQAVTFLPDEALDESAAPDDVKLSDVDLWQRDSDGWKSVKDAEGTASGASYAMRERGTFVNALANDQLIQGTKLWENIPGDVDPSAQLPDILVLVQRRLMGDTEWPEAYIKKDDDGTWSPTEGAFAWTDTFKQDGTTYTFTITKEGCNNGAASDAKGELPRYDEQGRRYEYRAIEVVTGLVGTTEGPEDLEGVNVAGENVDVSGGLYTVQHGEAGSFVLRNVFKSPQGNLTVKKIVEKGDRTENDVFPDVTFTLYRYDPSQDEKDSQKVGSSITIKGSEFSSSDKGETGIATCTFENLDIYTPSGAYWQYYVKETAINGYSTTVALGDLEADGVTNNGLKSDVAMRDGETLVASDDTVDITFKNTYDDRLGVEGGLTLTGEKHWDDHGNAFGTRPDKIDLALVRYTSSQSEEEVTLSTNDSTAEVYITWEKKDNVWTYTIHNLEQWAPDGRAWTYKVTEALDENNVSYKVVNGSATTTGSESEEGGKKGVFTGTFENLENRLAGSATVEKVWKDGDNEWTLRPSSVTVELQARVSTNNGGAWGEWGKADEVLSTDKIVSTVELAASSWSHSWDALPYQFEKDGMSYTVQYRVVETKVGEHNVTGAPSNELTVTYPLTASYNGAGETALFTSADETNHSQSSTSATTITNTLDATKIEVTKRWDDEDNKWGLRPTDGDKNWKVTYYLQRAVDTPNHENLSWEFIPDGKNGLVSRTVSGNFDGKLNEKTVTFENLPAKNTDGDDYVYRVVEEVPGGYRVSGGFEVNDTVGHVYSAVDVTWPSDDKTVSSQTFVNAINYISFSGEKLWDDHGTGTAPSDPENGPKPTIKLQQTTDPTNEDSWEDVNESLASPTWGKKDGDDNVWTWCYDNLPQTDAAGNPYTYRVVETESVSGFSIAQGVSTGTAAAADATTANQTGNQPLKNVATHFGFDKVNDTEEPAQVNNVELVVMRDDKVYAVWHRDSDGAESGYLWREGLSSSEAWPNTTSDKAFVSVEGTDAAPMKKDEKGRVLIVGLPAGDYTVIESGSMDNTPDGTTDHHVRMEPFSITVAEDGGITLKESTGVTVSTDTEDGTVLLTAVDPIFRAYFEFTKQLDDLQGTPLADVSFDLVREEDGTRTTIATGIKTASNGTFSSKSSSIAYEAGGDKAHVKLSDGLVPGNYVLVETDAPAGIHKPANQEFAFSISADDQDKTVKVTSEGAPEGVIKNTSFSTTVTMHKYDSTSKEGISDVTFRLKYRPTSGAAWTEVSEVCTDDGGNIALSLTEKGQYQLIEVANKGYKVSKLAFVFTVDDDDHDQERDLFVDAADLDLKIYRDGKEADDLLGTLRDGLPNDRLPGEATMRKVDAEKNDEGIDGAEFKLVRQSEDGTTWETVVENLETGTAYELGENETATATSEVVEAGVLKVTNLPWGTYKFVETASAPGYTSVDGPNGKPFESNSFVISRNADKDNNAGTVQSAKVTEEAISVKVNPVVNNKTTLTLRKAGRDGGVLPGATFVIRPATEDDSLAGSNQAQIKATTTDEGSVEIEKGLLIVKNSYTIEEVSAPAGYEVFDGEFTFTVTEHGGIVPAGESSVAGPTAAGYTIADNGLTLVLTDQPIDVSLVKMGKSGDSAAEALAGAVFEISSPGGIDAFGKTWQSHATAQDGGTISVTTGRDGALDLTGAFIQDNVYALKEVTAPAGYELLPGSLTFKVNADGSITPGELDADGAFTAGGDLPLGFDVSHEDGLVTITATDDLVEAQIRKVGMGDEPLTGATFAIKPVEGSSFGTIGLKHIGSPVTADGSVELRTDEEGVINLVGLLLPGDFYVISDVEAPAGYKPISPATITVDEAGAIWIVGEDDAKLDELVPADGVGSYRTDNNDGTAVLIVKDDPVSIDLVKQGQGEELLSGAELTITPADGYAFADGSTEPRTFTTEDGRATVAGILKVGTQYTATEAKAPAGYERNPGSLTFAVGADGGISVVGEPSDGFALGDDGVSVVVTDKPIELSLEKVDTRGNTLNGATFSIKGVFAGGFGESETRTYTVGTDGRLDLSGLVGGQTYVVTEVTAPAGYKLIDEPFELVVGEDGTISAEDTSEALQGGSRTTGYYVDDNGVTLVAVDELRPWFPPIDDPDEPGDPDDPENPDEPVDPDEPSEPEDPDTPDDPDDPDNPDEPVGPDEPSGPDVPDTPDTPEEPTGPSEPGGIVKPDSTVKPGGVARPETPDTGDHTNVGLPIVVGSLGAALAAVAVIVRRRMHE